MAPYFLATAQMQRHHFEDHLLPPLFYPEKYSSWKVKKRGDFTAGRLLARSLVNRFFSTSLNHLPNHSQGFPLWPESYLGSLSHCKNTVAVILGTQEHFKGLGIDVIEYARKEQVLRSLKRILTPEEQLFFKENQKDCPWYPLIVFSAKESLYKALYPIQRNYIGFQEVVMNEFNFCEQTFSLCYKKTTYQGSFFLDKWFISSQLFIKS